jgi:hypothetical protein
VSGAHSAQFFALDENIPRLQIAKTSYQIVTARKLGDKCVTFAFGFYNPTVRIQTAVSRGIKRSTPKIPERICDEHLQAVRLAMCDLRHSADAIGYIDLSCKTFLVTNAGAHFCRQQSKFFRTR